MRLKTKRSCCNFHNRLVFNELSAIERKLISDGRDHEATGVRMAAAAIQKHFTESTEKEYSEHINQQNHLSEAQKEILDAVEEYCGYDIRIPKTGTKKYSDVAFLKHLSHPITTYQAEKQLDFVKIITLIKEKMNIDDFRVISAIIKELGL